MRKLRLKPPANDTRPTRRSLVELTAAASRAAGEDVLVTPSSLIMVAAGDVPRAEEAANALARTEPPKQVTTPRVADSADPSSLRPAPLPDSGSAAQMLAQIAKDHQARALENIRLGLAAAVDFAKDLGRTPMPADRGPPQGVAPNLIATVGAAAEYRAKTTELVSANLATTLDYARDLAEARTSAEFVELSSALARKQCELMLKQAVVLQSFALTVTKGDRERS